MKFPSSSTASSLNDSVPTPIRCRRSLLLAAFPIVAGGTGVATTNRGRGAGDDHRLAAGGSAASPVDPQARDDVTRGYNPLFNRTRQSRGCGAKPIVGCVAQAPRSGLVGGTLHPDEQGRGRGVNTIRDSGVTRGRGVGSEHAEQRETHFRTSP